MDTQTGFTRGINTQWVSNPKGFVFGERYRELQKACEKCCGWYLLLPLGTAEKYYLRGISIPNADASCDSAQTVINLAKLLVDSLNDDALKRLVPYQKREKLKGLWGIALLEFALSFNAIQGADVHIAFLRELQCLRADGNVCKYPPVEIIDSATDVLDYFIALLENGPIEAIVRRNARDTADALFAEIRAGYTAGRTDASVNHDEVIYELSGAGFSGL